MKIDGENGVIMQDDKNGALTKDEDGKLGSRKKPEIFIIDANAEMAKILAFSLKKYRVKTFPSGIDAMNEIIVSGPPDLIFLEVLVDGPDSFAFLNELISYEDTMNIPVVIVSTLDFKGADLTVYSVAKVLDKAKMRPEDLKDIAQELLERDKLQDFGGIKNETD